MKMGSLFRTCLANEAALLRTDRRALWAIVSVLMLALMAAAWGAIRHAEHQHAARQGHEQAYKVWLSQDQKNPHSAAHFGLHVVRPASSLAFLDPGVGGFAGAVVWLEAHKRNSPLIREADDDGGLARFPAPSVAFVLAAIVPLLLVFIGYGCVSGERDAGRLGMLAASIGSFAPLLLAKAASLWLVAAALVLLATGTGLAVAALSGMGMPPTARLAWWMAAHLAHLAVWAAAIVVLSSLSRRSRTALMVLVLCWAASVFVIPRVAANVAQALSPLPGSYEFRDRLDQDLKRVRDPLWPEDGSVSEFEKQVLARHGVGHRDKLPVSMRALMLMRDEEVGYPVFDDSFGNLDLIARRQERIVSVASVLSPSLAMARLSAALAGSDAEHARRFLGEAELHRRRFMEMVNGDLLHNAVGREYTYKAGPELWSRAPAFAYGEPPLAWSLGGARTALLVMAAWLLAGVFLLVRIGARLAVR